MRDRRGRIFDLMRSCGASIHDLSMVDRLNMPFELGYAFGLNRLTSGGHDIVVLNDKDHEITPAG